MGGTAAVLVAPRPTTRRALFTCGGFRRLRRSADWEAAFLLIEPSLSGYQIPPLLTFRDVANSPELALLASILAGRRCRRRRRGSRRCSRCGRGNRCLVAAEVIRKPTPVVVALRRLRRRGLVRRTAAVFVIPGPSIWWALFAWRWGNRRRWSADWETALPLLEPNWSCHSDPPVCSRIRNVANSPELGLLAPGWTRRWWTRRSLLAAEIIRRPTPVIVALRRLRSRRGLVRRAAAVFCVPGPSIWRALFAWRWGRRRRRSTDWETALLLLEPTTPP